VRCLRLPISAALALGLLCGMAWAETLKFTATLEPEKAGAAKGTATLTVDTDTKKLDWSIDYSGLSAAPAMAAILSPPKDPKGNPGTVPLTLPAKPASPIGGTMQLTDDQIAGLKTGQWIVLLGTKQAPEIGGEIKPAP
jgi:CHRD domain-containing protein